MRASIRPAGHAKPRRASADSTYSRRPAPIRLDFKRQLTNFLQSVEKIDNFPENLVVISETKTMCFAEQKYNEDKCPIAELAMGLSSGKLKSVKTQNSLRFTGKKVSQKKTRYFALIGEFQAKIWQFLLNAFPGVSSKIAGLRSLRIIGFFEEKLAVSAMFLLNFFRVTNRFWWYI